MNKKEAFFNYAKKTKLVRRWKNRKNKKENWISKKKIRISDLDKRDQDVYQDIVEELLKNHNIPKDEITKQIKKRKQKNMCSI